MQEHQALDCMAEVPFHIIFEVAETYMETSRQEDGDADRPSSGNSYPRRT